MFPVAIEQSIVTATRIKWELQGLGTIELKI
jgi:hypothetical protein